MKPFFAIRPQIDSRFGKCSFLGASRFNQSHPIVNTSKQPQTIKNTTSNFQLKRTIVTTLPKQSKASANQTSILEDLSPNSVKACVIHPWEKRNLKKKHISPELRLEEIVSLVKTLDWNVMSSQVLNMREILNRTFFGTGKLKELNESLKQSGCNTLVVDTKLTTAQQAAIGAALPDIKVVDRFSVILEIFAQRAQTREAKLQVELASLHYKKTILINLYDSDDFAQQRGSTMSVSGAGETKLEVDRRVLADRERKIKQELESIQKHREVLRKSRRNVPVVGIVGYTNAGKSALVNRLGKAALESRNQVFTSLDPHTRGMTLPSGRRILLLDTVGFISDLPGILLTAFRSTLEEVLLCDLLLHVETDYQRDNVLAILKSLKVPRQMMQNHIEVWNKIDMIGNSRPVFADMIDGGALQKKLDQVRTEGDKHEIMPISALKGTNCDQLEELMDTTLTRILQSNPEKAT